MFQISLAAAFLIGAFLECIMYGIFIPLFIAGCYVQWKKFSHGKEINYVMVFATVFFGCTVTIDCVITVHRVLQATLDTPSGTSAYDYLHGRWPIVEVVRFAIFQCQVVAADAIMIYRMFHIYDRKPFVCIIPSITTAALFSTACGLANQLRNPGGLKARDSWSWASFCLTIFNGLFTTIAISIKLWSVHRETSKVNIQVKDSIVLRAMKVLIEGAALWTTFVVLNFCSYLANSNITFTFLAMTSPAAGISFCLIIVRLGRILPEARDETWHVSIPTRGPRTQRLEQVVVPFSRIEVQREVFVSDSGDSSSVENLERQKQEYVNHSGDLPKVTRAPRDVPTSP